MPWASSRAASHALEHIWITDDVLAQAFQRFVQVSHAHRRYGSHVPGPLEARRRLAKRRIGMGAVAAGASPQPAVFDLGALFGLRSAKPPPDFEKEWKWRPPSQLPPTPVALDQSATYNSFWEVGDSSSNLATEKEPINVDATEVSKAAYDALLLRHGAAAVMSKDSIDQLVAFLDSSANEPDAWLTLRLVQWLASRQEWGKQIWQGIARSIVARAQNSEISVEEVASILEYLLFDSAEAAKLVPLFTQSPSTMAGVYSRLLEKILHSGLDKKSQKQKINTWLSVTYPPEDFKAIDRQPGDEWHRVYELLAHHFRSSDFPEHFGKFSVTKLSWLLFHHWVPHDAAGGLPIHDDLESAHVSQSTTTHKDTASYNPFQDEQMGTKDKESYSEAYHIYAHNRDSGIHQLTFLVRQLARSGTKHDDVVRDIFRLYMKIQHPWNIMDLFMNMTSTREIVVPTGTGVELVKHFLATNNLTYALAIFRLVPSIPLRACQELPLKLIEEGCTSRFTRSPLRFWEVLTRSTAEDFVPLDQRREVAHSDNNALLPEHVQLVHDAAWAWANSPHINARTAFRRVWESYVFLRSRRAPISSKMSRAIVRAGLARAVAENKRLNKTQVKYIISLIQRIEGEGAAIELDNLVYKHWQYVKARHRYTPGAEQEQKGRFGKHNTRIWGKHHKSLRTGRHLRSDDQLQACSALSREIENGIEDEKTSAVAEEERFELDVDEPADAVIIPPGHAMSAPDQSLVAETSPHHTPFHSSDSWLDDSSLDGHDAVKSTFTSHDTPYMSFGPGQYALASEAAWASHLAEERWSPTQEADMVAAGASSSSPASSQGSDFARSDPPTMTPSEDIRGAASAKHQFQSPDRTVSSTPVKTPTIPNQNVKVYGHDDPHPHPQNLEWNLNAFAHGVKVFSFQDQQTEGPNQRRKPYIPSVAHSRSNLKTAGEGAKRLRFNQSGISQAAQSNSLRPTRASLPQDTTRLSATTSSHLKTSLNGESSQEWSALVHRRLDLNGHEGPLEKTRPVLGRGRVLTKRTPKRQDHAPSGPVKHVRVRLYRLGDAAITIHGAHMNVQRTASLALGQHPTILRVRGLWRMKRVELGSVER